MPFSHIDLFSGIGGFALATEMVWKDVQHIFCDNEPFSQAIIKKHWPDSPIYGDIKTLTANTESKRKRELAMERKQNKKTAKSRRDYTGVDLITGGFPCQPFSQAGRRKGTADDRHLWPEMFRVIHEFHPRWVIAENVRGLVNWSGGMVLGQVRSDLENDGYEVQSFIIPACAVNAPHRRDRIWIVAHTESERARGKSRTIHGEDGRSNTKRARDTEQPNTDAFNSERIKRRSSKGRNMDGTILPKGEWEKGADAIGRPNSDVTDTSNARPQRRRKEWERHDGQCNRDGSNERPDWNKDWTEVATALCRMDDGVSRRLDRTPRLKALGNAIVPQVAAQIMMAIKKADEQYGR